MIEQTFTIMGIPQGQGRPRFARIGQHVTTYDSKQDKANKGNIRAQLVANKPVYMPGPVSLTMTFYMPRPKLHYNAKGEKKISAPTFHTARPDLDNLTKAVMDAAKGVLWQDDSQVCMQSAVKYYADAEPKTVVTVREA